MCAKFGSKVGILFKHDVSDSMKIENVLIGRILNYFERAANKRIGMDLSSESVICIPKCNALAPTLFQVARWGDRCTQGTRARKILAFSYAGSTVYE